MSPKTNPARDPTPKGGVPKVRANGPHAPRPAKTRSGAPCKECIRVGRKCRLHGGKSTGPKTVEGKKAARVNATKHGLKADPLIFLDGMPAEQRAAFDGLVATLAREEGCTVQADLMLVRDLVLADLILQRGTQYLLAEWSTSYGDGTPPQVAQDGAARLWAGFSKLKTQLRAALRTGTGARGDPGRQTIDDVARGRAEAIAAALEGMGVDLAEVERRATLSTPASDGVSPASESRGSGREAKET